MRSSPRTSDRRGPGGPVGRHLPPLVGLMLLAACGEGEKEQAAAPQAPQATVTVAAVASAEVAPAYEFIGRVRAVDSVDLRARVEGFLEKRLFDEGAMVKAGDLLFTIEKAQYQALVDQAEADVASRQAVLANAELQLSRAQELVRNNNIPVSQRDQRLTERDSAKAGLLASQAQLEQARLNLSYTDVATPVAGKIGRAAFSVGNLVQPSSGVLATVVSQDPIYVTFPVSQRQILEVRKRQAEQGGDPSKAIVHVRLADGSAYPRAGTIDFADNKVDQATDTLLIRAVLPNPDRVLVDGQFANVTAEAGDGRKSTVVPQAAIQMDQAGPYVLVVDAQGKVESRRVRPGPAQGTNLAVDGVKEGERVIVDGALKIRPGQAVKATDAAAPAAKD